MSEPTQKDEATSAGTDLTIWRDSSSSRLRVDEHNDPEPEDSLSFVLRMLISFFALFAIILVATPHSSVPAGLSLDVTVNISVLAPLIVSGASQDFVTVPDSAGTLENFTFSLLHPTPLTPSSGRRRDPSLVAIPEAAEATEEMEPVWWPFHAAGRANRPTRDGGVGDEDDGAAATEYSSGRPGRHASALAVPALFGRSMPAPSFAAPLIVLDEDACSPFTFSLPDALLHLPADRVNKHAEAVTAAAAAEMPPSTPGDVQFASKSPAMVDPASISAPATDVKHTVGGSSNQLTAEHLHVGPEAATAASSSHSKGRAFVAVQLGNWYGLVQRGNCPFDVKVLNAQRAGLAGVIIYNSVLAAARSRDQPVRMSSNAVGGEITETHASFLTNYDAQCIINAASSTGEGNHSSHGVMNTFGRFPLTGVRTHPRLLLVSLSTDAWPRNGWFSPAFDPLNTNSVIKPVGTAANVNKLSAVSMVADIVLIAVILLTSTALCFIACILIALLRNCFCHGRLFVVFYGPPQSRANGGAARRRTPRRPPTAGAHHVTGEETSLIEGNVDGNQQPAADAAIANTNPAQLRTGRRFGFSAFFGGYSIAQDHEDLQVDDEDSSEDDDDDGVLEKITLPIRIIEARDLMDCDGSSSRISEDGLGGGAVGGSKECCAICIDEFLIGSRVRKLPCNHQFHDACIDPWLINHNRLCPICKRDVLMPTDKARLKTCRIAEEETATAPAQLTRRATLVMEEGDGRNSNGASGNGSLRSSFSEVFGFSRWGIQWGGRFQSVAPERGPTDAGETAGELPSALTTQTDQE